MEKDYCEAPSTAAGLGVGTLGAVLTPSPILGIPIGLIMRHYGKKDCTWWATSAGTGLLVGSAVQVVVVAAAVVTAKLKVAQMQSSQQQGALPQIPRV